MTSTRKRRLSVLITAILALMLVAPSAQAKPKPTKYPSVISYDGVANGIYPFSMVATEETPGVITGLYEQSFGGNQGFAGTPTCFTIADGYAAVVGSPGYQGAQYFYFYMADGSVSPSGQDEFYLQFQSYIEPSCDPPSSIFDPAYVTSGDIILSPGGKKNAGKHDITQMPNALNQLGS